MAITKSHLINRLAETNGLPKRHAREIVQLWIEIIKRTLMSGEDLSIRDFGRFCIKTRSKRRGKNFTTGQQLIISPRKVITFNPSAHLKNYLNAGDEGAQSVDALPSPERRGEPRLENVLSGKAVIRIGGIPVYEFGIKDVSDGGACFIVNHDSTLLRNIWIGQAIEIQVTFNGDKKISTVNQRCEIRHITYPTAGRAKGNVLIGVKILSQLIL